MKLSDKQVEALWAVAMGAPWKGIKGGSATGFARASRNRTLISLENAELVDGHFMRGSYECRAGGKFTLTKDGEAHLYATQDRVIESRAEELRTYTP